MRGFGAVQACFAYESQMDKLAEALGLHPVEVRARNAMAQGTVMPTGQVVDQPAPVADLLRRVREAPLPSPEPLEPGPKPLSSEPGRSRPPAGPGANGGRLWPGGVANTTHGEGVVRGIGYAVGFKNVGYSEGYDDYSTARVTLSCAAGRPIASVHTAACEVGQGVVGVQAQIARTELAIERVVVETADTGVGSAGSSSASRQTYMTGGAVRAACEEVREEVLRRAAAQLDVLPAELGLEGEAVVSRSGLRMELADLLADGPVERTVEWRHRPTAPIDPETGQGNAHVQYSFAAHRAVVDVDTELGTGAGGGDRHGSGRGKSDQPGRRPGPGPRRYGAGTGAGLMEEIQVEGGRRPQPLVHRLPDPDHPGHAADARGHSRVGRPRAPYGLRGVGEAPTISSTPAIVAAVRAATGQPLTRVPLRPDDIIGADGGPEREDHRRPGV